MSDRAKVVWKYSYRMLGDWQAATHLTASNVPVQCTLYWPSIMANPGMWIRSLLFLFCSNVGSCLWAGKLPNQRYFVAYFSESTMYRFIILDSRDLFVCFISLGDCRHLGVCVDVEQHIGIFFFYCHLNELNWLLQLSAWTVPMWSIMKNWASQKYVIKSYWRGITFISLDHICQCWKDHVDNQVSRTQNWY